MENGRTIQTMKLPVPIEGEPEEEYVVETTFPYEFHHCKTLKEAKKKRAELRRNGRCSSIVVVDENGNDRILAI